MSNSRLRVNQILNELASDLYQGTTDNAYDRIAEIFKEEFLRESKMLKIHNELYILLFQRHTKDAIDEMLEALEKIATITLKE